MSAFDMIEWIAAMNNRISNGYELTENELERYRYYEEKIADYVSDVEYSF